jgi:hypothetical protein
VGDTRTCCKHPTWLPRRVNLLAKLNAVARVAVASVDVIPHCFMRPKARMVLIQLGVAAKAIPYVSMAVRDTYSVWSTDEQLAVFSTKMFDDFTEIVEVLILASLVGTNV